MKLLSAITLCLLFFSCTEKSKTEEKEISNNKEVINDSTKTDSTTIILENKIKATLIKIFL